MASTALRPRSSTEIVDTAFQIYKAHLGPFVVSSALANAPLLIVQLLFVGDPRTIDPAQVNAYASRGGLVMLFSLLTYALMTAVLITCTSQAYLGEPVDVGTAVRRTVRKLPALIAASFFATVMIGIGLLLLLVPAVYFAARYFAVTQAVILEDAGVGTAFTRSSVLSRGRKRHILSTLGLAFLIYFVLYFGITLVTALAGFVVQTITTTVVGAVIYPILAITHTLLYYDVRIRSEGLDIELMAGALSPLPAAH